MSRKQGIYRRKDGRYSCEVYIGNDPATGKTIQKTIYGKTAHEVERKRAELRRQIDRGLDATIPAQTVTAFLTTWLNTVKRTRKESTYFAYEQKIRLYVLPYIGRMRLDQLRAAHVQTMLNHLIDEGLSARSVQHVRAVLRNALNTALKHGIVSMNAAAIAEGPPVPRFRGKVLTPEQVRLLLTQMKGYRLEPLYWLALLGIREGELIALRWNDINFEVGVLIIQQGKTESSRRVLPLSGSMLDRLAQHYQFQQQEQQQQGDSWNPDGLVFPSQAGTPLTAQNLSRHFKRMLDLVGLPDMRFHDLRHTAASLMQARGVPLRVVSELLGHADIDITQQIYSHALESEKVSATAYLDVLLGDS